MTFLNFILVFGGTKRRKKVERDFGTKEIFWDLILYFFKQFPLLKNISKNLLN